jgi:integrase
MASSGIRVGAIQTLKVKSIKRLDGDVGIVTVYQESKDSIYATLVTPEFLTSLDEYLKYRKSQGEKITGESCLIRDKFATFSKKTNRPTPPSNKSINKQMRFLVRKAGLPLDDLQPNHSPRKFFNTALMNSDVAYTFKELLMGHSAAILYLISSRKFMQDFKIASFTSKATAFFTSSLLNFSGPMELSRNSFIATPGNSSL